MVKETGGPDSSRKRRKAVTSPVPQIQKKVTHESASDIYKTVVIFEEEEAQKSDPDKNQEIFHDTCDEIRTLINEIALLKKKPNSSAEIAEKQVQVSLLFVVLKKLNRLEKFRTKHSRENLNRVKLQVDSYHLQLQNLLYEVMHLRKEVTKCLQFKSKDEEIELVSIEEFYKQAPPSISKPEVTKDHPHKLKLARLEWELEQRKNLSVLCQKLQSNKEVVANDINKRQEKLQNLMPKLKAVLEGTKPLQEYLGLPLDKLRKQHEVAGLLPKPLYILYVEVDGYREACDPLLQISINGDEDEARNLIQQNEEVVEIEEIDSDIDEVAEESQEHQKRHHRKTRLDRQEEKKNKLLMKHPLTVELIVFLKDKSKIVLTFSYLIHLHIVTVVSKVTLAKSVEGISAMDLVSPHRVLCSLFPHDIGADSPNIANHYQLSSVGLGDFCSLIPQLGIPYVWAQRLAGLDFVGNNSACSKLRLIEPQVSVSRVNVESIVKAIRKRLGARQALCTQVQSLEKCHVPLLASMRSLFTNRISNHMLSWQCITWEEYSTSPFGIPMCEKDFVCKEDSFYKAVFSRGTARLLAMIAVKCDYPRNAAIFSLHVNWNGFHTASNSDAILDMERELNVYWKELTQNAGWGHSLLAAQLTRLMVCFDIYLEAVGTTGVSPTEFAREKVFLKATRGRNRCRPYKFLPVGGGIFTQR